MSEALAHDATFAPGARIGDDYEIVAPISSGGMGAVYHARRDGRDVALKRLTDRSQATRFEIEARLLAQLRHPRVVRVIDSFETGGDIFLVMDLVAGTDLAGVLRERGAPGLPVDDAVALVLEACEALQYVHEQQVVHRDVKPQNLIAGREGVVLVDFGVARSIEGDDPGTRAIGTPQFMAPEVLVGEPVSPRSDVYGVAATLWTLLTGKPPSYQDPTPLAQTVPGVDRGVEETVRAGLELQPEKRVSSVAAFAQALGSPLSHSAGESLAVSAAGPAGGGGFLEAIVRTAAGVFEAAAASIALVDRATGELVYQAAWGAGAREIVGVRMPPGAGIAGAAVASGEAIAVPECRTDPRFAAQVAAGTGYVPNTLLVVPLERGGEAVGALSILDRRDGGGYGPAVIPRAALFAELTVAALPAVSTGA